MVRAITDSVKLTGKLVYLESPIDMIYAELLAEIANDITIRDMIGAHSFPHPYTVENAKDFIDRNRVMDSLPFALDFMIFYKNKPAGVVGLSDINYLDNKAHIGYWVGREFRGKGVASESAALVCNYAFGELKLHRLHTKVIEDNLASMRVLVTNGFEIEGIERDAFYTNNSYKSLILFSRIEKQSFPSM